MVESSPKVLTCTLHASKKDGIVRFQWGIDFQISVTKQGDQCMVKDDSSLKENHRTMKRILPALVMFREWFQSEVPVEGEIASIILFPDDTENSQGLSRIVQALKDSYRTMHPDQWKAKYENI
jgi:hypothetical protein